MDPATEKHIQEAFAARDKAVTVRITMIIVCCSVGALVILLIVLCTMPMSDDERFLREQRERDEATAEALGITPEQVEQWRKYGKGDIVTKQDREEAATRVDRAKGELRAFLNADEATQAKELGVTVEELRRMKTEAAKLGH